MVLPQRWQFVNPTYCCGGDTVFYQFARLPPELRWRVWTLSLQRHRLVEVVLSATADFKADEVDETACPPYSSTTNTLGNPISSQGYRATVLALGLHSKLLRINRESRQAALELYRVHIPCYFQTKKTKDLDPRAVKGRRSTRSILYFNPEYDFLQPIIDEAAVALTPVNFLHDLRAYDPRGIGLLNLAMEHNRQAGLVGFQRVNKIGEELARASFVSILSQLQDIVWVVSPSLKPIQVGPVKYHFNAPMPVKPITPYFELLDQDPRSIRSDQNVVMSTTIDLRWLSVNWQKLLSKWGIHYTRPVRERVLVASAPRRFDEQVYNTRSARTFLEGRREGNVKLQRQLRGNKMAHATRVAAGKPEESEEPVQTASQAVGFWLFPVEALGPPEQASWVTPIEVDMTGYSPELAISTIT